MKCELNSGTLQLLIHKKTTKLHNSENYTRYFIFCNTYFIITSNLYSETMCLIGLQGAAKTHSYETIVSKKTTINLFHYEVFTTIRKDCLKVNSTKS